MNCPHPARDKRENKKRAVRRYEMSDKKGYSGTGTKADLGNHSNQCNPNHSEHRGYSSSYQGKGTTADLGNHANQSNPNNKSYQAPKK
ncbi:hypothetical protein LSAT2_007558 [Lamellibrachia satsuma]|nr:hypothetical protein LSAT2_007558 [Lamellibrachia satsuma]